MDPRPRPNCPDLLQVRRATYRRGRVVGCDRGVPGVAAKAGMHQDTSRRLGIRVRIERRLDRSESLRMVEQVNLEATDVNSPPAITLQCANGGDGGRLAGQVEAASIGV